MITYKNAIPEQIPLKKMIWYDSKILLHIMLMCGDISYVQNTQNLCGIPISVIKYFLLSCPTAVFLIVSN